jgi:hypothetical protein
LVNHLIYVRGGPDRRFRAATGSVGSTTRCAQIIRICVPPGDAVMACQQRRTAGIRASPGQVLMAQREMKQGPHGSWAAGRPVAQDAGAS